MTSTRLYILTRYTLSDESIYHIATPSGYEWLWWSKEAIEERKNISWWQKAKVIPLSSDSKAPGFAASIRQKYFLQVYDLVDGIGYLQSSGLTLTYRSQTDVVDLSYEWDSDVHRYAKDQYPALPLVRVTNYDLTAIIKASKHIMSLSKVSKINKYKQIKQKTSQVKNELDKYLITLQGAFNNYVTSFDKVNLSQKLEMNQLYRTILTDSDLNSLKFELNDLSTLVQQQIKQLKQLTQYHHGTQTSTRSSNRD